MLRLMSLHLRRCLYSGNASLSFPGLSAGAELRCHNGASSLAIRRAAFAAVSDGSAAARGGTSKAGDDSRWMKKPDPPAESAPAGAAKTNITDGKFYFDADVENLSPEQQQQKEELIRELTRKLSGPLADENGNLPTGDDRPIAIEVDGPSHFYANSTKYTAYTKLKHRLLTRMGYKVLHVPYFEWRRLRGAKEREEYMREKLKEEPTEWIDPDDEAFYNKRMEALRRQTDGVISALEAESKASAANDA
ncbi:FAST LEU-RICH DOMAIN-CONTAINING protein, putative [Babesia bigemina]|uniref:FAST LEU-RICH DOMAIN-CONTAINING protein, putative n=1 Tax=Babesia bigemina TaxID=5866 RepID=A0A061DEK0_BABBI|nr:FAST LEU-RICH DOMAIN-CONTAINING protein, putative [Babesia bigemina]CDR97415.1 FAST LEU-RICH DOMAIN-CONTAINING protein, putative [Babesia bigemina]|eukprot:XP_012769601.1 FAST LEU-RICH DOMAIN-CONTAINING protein, putative [Babesia bigemina]